MADDPRRLFSDIFRDAAEKDRRIEQVQRDANNLGPDVGQPSPDPFVGHRHGDAPGHQGNDDG